MGIMAHAPLVVARHAAERMRERGGGRIVNVSSLGASRTLPHYGLAGTAKAALEALTRYLAVELGALGINVNGVSPGAVRSPGMPDPWDLLPEKDEILADIARRTPLGRFVSPEEVARVVGFLCGPGGAAIAGQTLTVDCGFSVNW
jgi:enoyl-[acyl-carrier protein] reductase III